MLFRSHGSLTRLFALNPPLLTKVEPFVIHHKTEGVTPSATAKAVVKLLVWIDRKRSGALIMKLATSGIIFTGFFELNASVDDLDNIEAIEQVV